jgi:two-component system LytT family sensor kinase
VYSDPEIADKMIARLSELLRISLEYENINEIELKKELDFTDGYIEIQQIRFDNKLKISKDINPQAYDALVPSFIVQPLVENSIRHGFMKFENADNIFISSSIRGNKLKLVVADKGPGIAKNWNIENYRGHSLYNMKQRMSQLYGSDYRFEIANGLNGGLTVTIEIPYNLAGAK